MSLAAMSAPRSISRDGYLSAKDGLSLYYRERLPEGARAHVVLVHGVSEHYGRYRWVEDTLAAQGIGLSMIDLRGHGQSEGARIHVNHFEEYLDDLDVLFEHVEAHAKGRIFLVGHSLGGLISVRYTQTRRPRIRGLITSGAALKATLKPPPPVFAALRAINMVYSKARVPGMVKLEKISRDPEIVRRYRDDPLVPKFLTTGFGIASMKAMAASMRDAHLIDVPALLMHGGDDVLVDKSASEELFRGLRVADRTLKIYPRLYHEIFNEPEKQSVLSDVTRWIAERAS